jgi:hypothetical protein
MRRECEMHAIYMRDCSRAGMGLVSPIQLFPRERIQIWMNPQRSYALEVIRCRRICAQGYECGTIFILKPIDVDDSYNESFGWGEVLLWQRVL